MNLTRSYETKHIGYYTYFMDSNISLKLCPPWFSNSLNTFIVAKGKLKKFSMTHFLLFYLYLFFCYYTFFALLKTPHPVHRVIVLLAKYFGENLTGRSNQINKFVFYLSSSTEYFLLEIIR